MNKETTRRLLMYDHFKICSVRLIQFPIAEFIQHYCDFILNKLTIF